MNSEKLENKLPKLLTVKEVMEVLRVSRTTLWQMTKRGEIGSYKIGNESRYSEEDIRAYLDSIRQEPKRKSSGNQK